MCGIAGIICDREEESQQRLERMVYAMRHRGPDGEGYVHIPLLGDRELGFGHTRLSLFQSKMSAIRVHNENRYGS